MNTCYCSCRSRWRRRWIAISGAYRAYSSSDFARADFFFVVAVLFGSLFLSIHRLELKVDPSFPAVLCTATETFALQRVETSNCCLLMQPTAVAAVPVAAGGDGDDDDTPSLRVLASVSCHHEAQPTAPALHVLRSVLGGHLYAGPTAADDAAAGGGVQELDTLAVDEDVDVDLDVHGDDDGDAAAVAAAATGAAASTADATKPPPLTTDVLCAKVPCSRQQLLDGLASLQALEIDGCWRLLDWDYAVGVTDLVIAHIVEVDAPTDAVPVAPCVAALSMYPEAVVRHCLLSQLGRAADPTGTVAAVDHRRVALLRAEQVLRGDADGGLTTDEFLEAWEQALPVWDLKPSLDLVRDLLLVDPDPDSPDAPPTVRYFPERELSPHPGTRFKELFAVRPRWRLEDLTPFITPLVGPSQSKDDLLLSHTRSTAMPDGTRLFSAR